MTNQCEPLAQLLLTGDDSREQLSDERMPDYARGATPAHCIASLLM
jgi:hypothetical protein